MTYDQALEKVHSCLKFGIRPGLGRISHLLSALGNPQDKLQFVHVAGTNGKGSVSNMLANIFIKAGKRTGLFTSPFIIDFRERIQLDGEFISKTDFVSCAEEVFKIASVMVDQPTEFEIITAIAFYYFFLKNCDVVVLEVGLGGRLDSTNVIGTPLASVITKVSLDHMNILGNTVSEIAAEKAGIIKPGGITVVSPNQDLKTLQVISDRAEELGNKLVVCKNLSKSYNGKRFLYKDRLYELKLLGSHQVENAITAIETAKAIGVDDMTIAFGIKATVLPARFEVLSTKPVVILDGAHNQDGVKTLAKNVRHFLKGRKVVSVVAMMEDKQWQEGVIEIGGFSSTVIATKSSNPRSVDPAKVVPLLGCELDYDFKSAVRRGLELASSDPTGALLVCGSLYLASDVRDYLIKLLSN